MSTVIIDGARTPIGKFGKALAGHSGVGLGAVAIREALRRSGLPGSDIDYVIMGQVLQAGTGLITARQAAITAGIPKGVPALTINKVCLSGLNAIALTDQLIRAGEIQAAVAGGMESMSQAPYLTRGARWGVRMGNEEFIDAMIFDGLRSPFDGEHVGAASDRVNRELGITRADQDAWAARSHRRAADASRDGSLAEELTPVPAGVDQASGVLLGEDEGVRTDVTESSLASLPPAFTANGTITVGNAAQISDGAAAVVVTSMEKARSLGLRPLAEIVTHGMCADEFAYLHTVPAIALQRAMKKAGMVIGDIDLVEVNEAFAAVAVHATRMLGADEAIVNVNGGAVAQGHPIGASGARLVLTLAKQMERRGIEIGAATICGGGGQGDALILRRVSDSSSRG